MSIGPISMDLDTSHLGGAYEHIDAYTHWPDVWERIVEQYGIGSVVDIGCGYGNNLKWFYDRGLRVCGVEAWQPAVDGYVLPRETLVVHDFTTGPVALDEFDLCLCTEFAEHVEAQYEPNWILATRKAKYLLMCHGLPEQGGHHHVNLHASQYWIDRLKEFGWELDVQETGRIRATGKFAEGYWAGWDHPWGRPTGLFFK